MNYQKLAVEKSTKRCSSRNISSYGYFGGDVKSGWDPRRDGITTANQVIIASPHQKIGGENRRKNPPATSAMKRLKNPPHGMLRPYSALLVQFGRILDNLLIILCLYLACWINGENCSGDYWPAVILIIVVFSIVAQSNQLYRSWRIAPLHTELDLIWRSWIYASLVLVFVLYLSDRISHYPRLVLLSWILATPVFISLIRLVTRLGLRTLRSLGRNCRTVVVIGATDMGQRIADSINFMPWTGLKFKGFFDDRISENKNDRVCDTTPISGPVDELVKIARNGEIDIIYIALPMRSELRIKELLEKFSDTTVSIYYAPDFTVFDLLHAQWEHYGNIPIVRIVDSPFQGTNAIVKRIEDVILALVILMIITLPMLIIALAIRLTSPGPVIFNQRRYGLNGEVFYIWKFRSMTTCEDGADFSQVTCGDPRVTALGAFLRRTSLDELPQFINVLQGRMSIVGPRPHPIALNEQHRKLVNRYMLRHKVMPGITGWAQVNGYRGETDTLDKMKKRIEYDLEYIQNWSVWFDLQIIILTVFHVLFDRDAY